MPGSRDMKSPTSSIVVRWRKIVLSVSIYSKCLGYNNHLIQLGVNLPDDCVIDRILQSLPPSYKSFVMNYNMQGMDKRIPDLFAMLKVAEVEIKKEHQVLMVNKTTSFKKKGQREEGELQEKQQASCCSGEETQVWT